MGIIAKKRLIWVIAAIAIGVGSIFGGRNDGKDSIADIIQEMKNGDLSRTKDLAEAYRYGQGVEKSMLNAMICYQIAGVDFESEAKRTFKENPNDEFARLFTLLNMYDRHYIEEAKALLSDTPDPAPAWATMMKKVLDYKGDDINGYILSLIGPDSTPDECFLAFGCFISNNKESNDLKPLMDISSVLTDKAPFFNNVLAQAKLEEYKTNPEGNKELLSEALTYFKKANDAGFLTPRSARLIFEDDIQNNIDLTTIFSSEDLEQLKRLAASATSESNP